MMPASEREPGMKVDHGKRREAAKHLQSRQLSTGRGGAEEHKWEAA